MDGNAKTAGVEEEILLVWEKNLSAIAKETVETKLFITENIRDREAKLARSPAIRLELNTREIRTSVGRKYCSAYLVPREEVTFSGSDGPIPELCHEMDSLGPAVSKLQGKTERRLPLRPTAANFSSFRSPLAPRRSLPTASSLLSFDPRANHLLLPPSTEPAGKRFHGPEHPTSIRHFGPCYDTPLPWLPYCEIPPFFLTLPIPLPPPFYLLLNFFSYALSFLPSLYFPSFASPTRPALSLFQPCSVFLLPHFFSARVL